MGGSVSRVFEKIGKGILWAGKAVVSGLSAAVTGAGVGAAFGPVGAAVGAIAGALVSAVSSAPGLVDIINQDDEPDVKSVVERPQQQMASSLSYALANPKDPGSQVALGTVQGIKNGGTWRSSWISAGGHHFGRALNEGQMQGLINRAGLKIGVDPKTALAHGNGALRSAMHMSQSASNFNSINDHIHNAAYAMAAKTHYTAPAGGGGGKGVVASGATA